jgi:hypothetical protein
LNGTAVSDRERLEAELLCLRSGELFRHRAKLAERHDFDQNAVSRPKNPKVAVVFTYAEKKAERKLPLSTSLSNVLAVYVRLFGLAEQLESAQDGEGQLRIQVGEAQHTVKASDRVSLADYVDDAEPNHLVVKISLQ